jgi:hypothetical protein
VVTDMGAFATAAVLVMLAAFNTAHLFPTAVAVATRADPNPDMITIGGMAARVYPAAAAVGLTLAAIYGLGTDAVFGPTTDPFLPWTLKAATPVAVLGLLTGLIDLERAGHLGLSATGATGLLARLRPVTRDQAPARGEASS